MGVKGFHRCTVCGEEYEVGFYGDHVAETHTATGQPTAILANDENRSATLCGRNHTGREGSADHSLHAELDARKNRGILHLQRMVGNEVAIGEKEDETDGE